MDPFHRFTSQKYYEMKVCSKKDVKAQDFTEDGHLVDKDLTVREFTCSQALFMQTVWQNLFSNTKCSFGKALPWTIQKKVKSCLHLKIRGTGYPSVLKVSRACCEPLLFANYPIVIGDPWTVLWYYKLTVWANLLFWDHMSHVLTSSCTDK